MSRLSKNFDRTEFECKCQCGTDTVDAELIRMLQDVRDKFGPIKINSGVRCVDHNKKEGGAKHSQHLKGRAADIVPLNATIAEVWNYINSTYPACGLGLYSSFIHVDSRGSKARWG